jgi:hypothetical protein|tara:strand:+ start:2813 stop:3064 length:252 start_codon:yes stop_codon:yes gene_type:complete
MAQTFIVKGSVVTNASDNDFSRAQYVRITATGDTTAVLEESNGSTVIGQVYLEDGDTVIIEKHPAEKITCPTSKASAVGSPRS